MKDAMTSGMLGVDHSRSLRRHIRERRRQQDYLGWQDKDIYSQNQNCSGAKIDNNKTNKDKKSIVGKKGKD